VVSAVASGFAGCGIATMAFNYRGTGSSEGRANDDAATAVEDYTGALDALAERVPGPYLAAGYSFGSRAALTVSATDTRVRGAVLIAPPVDMVGAQDFAAFAGPLLVVVGDRDAYAPLDRLRSALAARPDALLEVVEGADHFFGATGTSAITERVAAHVTTWLRGCTAR
jgi:alpha/beta superfamily hydrolase